MYGISQDHLYVDQYRTLKGPFKPQEYQYQYIKKAAEFHRKSPFR